MSGFYSKIRFRLLAIVVDNGEVTTSGLVWSGGYNNLGLGWWCYEKKMLLENKWKEEEEEREGEGKRISLSRPWHDWPTYLNWIKIEIRNASDVYYGCDVMLCCCCRYAAVHWVLFFSVMHSDCCFHCLNLKKENWLSQVGGWTEGFIFYYWWRREILPWKSFSSLEASGWDEHGMRCVYYMYV